MKKMAQQNHHTNTPLFFCNICDRSQQHKDNHDITGIPYKTVKLSLDSLVGSIKQVLTFPNKKLLIITDVGLLYAIVGGSITNTYKFDQNSSLDLKLVSPFDGSSPEWKAIQMAGYTEAVLIIAKSKSQSLLYGIGDNGYYRMTHFKAQNFRCDVPEIMFDPLHNLSERLLSKEDGEITHVGCCYSFSVCVLNGHDVHFTGQNWLSSSKNLVSGYHCWSHRSQTMKTRVVKLECGDFHVVLLHEDHSISVAGNNNNHQLTSTANFIGDDVFCTLDLNFLSAYDIFSGSNSMVYIKKDIHNTHKTFYFAGVATAQAFALSGNGTVDKINHGTEIEKVTLSGSNREFFDIQYTRDFCIIRYFDRPHLLFLYGRLYYGGHDIEHAMIDLSRIVPYDLYSKCVTNVDNFYRDIVQIRIQPIGFAVYCDFIKYSYSRMSQLLFKALNPENPNNHLFFDISIV